MCMVDQGDGPSFWTETQFRARKVHRCCECYRDIKAGEQYWKSFGVNDGTASSDKMCEHCRVPAQWLSKSCGGFLYSMVEEDIREHATGNLPLLRFVVGMRRKWRSFTDPSRLLPVPAQAVSY